MRYQDRSVGARAREAARIAACRAKLRAYVLELKQAGCSRCPEKHPACLQFHHLDPATKDLSINQMISHKRNLEKLKAEIEKCILVCANCHAKIHWEETH